MFPTINQTEQGRYTEPWFHALPWFGFTYPRYSNEPSLVMTRKTLYYNFFSKIMLVLIIQISLQFLDCVGILSSSPSIFREGGGGEVFRLKQLQKLVFIIEMLNPYLFLLIIKTHKILPWVFSHSRKMLNIYQLFNSISAA